MATTQIAPGRPTKRRAAFTAWLLAGHPREREGPHARDLPHHDHPWWQVMCLTGVDYFSTLGYQPGIAALAAGALAPLATLILVLITLFGALPMYKVVATKSPHGDGSISMLERLLPWWQGKLFVLVLIGFVATSFVITITLSAADAAAHIAENPFAGSLADHSLLVTLVLIVVLGAVFLKGFAEAIGLAVGIVVAYLSLNLVVIGRAVLAISQHPLVLPTWRTLLLVHYGNPLVMLAIALLLFPKLALGLSGFETGVVVMPLVRGDPTDDPVHPAGRTRNTHKLLTTAASIMSVLLITSSLVTTLLIPPAAFQPGGPANGRALAYLAHRLLGDGFGTLYDLSTILILWFAGASAMAGLLNIVPRYLPRYGMAPDWARAARPLTLVFTAIALGVTTIFHASVDAQAGAYATGVLAVITSASIAVALAMRQQRRPVATLRFGLIALIFAYTTLVTVIAEPDGIRIAACFIAGIIVVSLVSRALRSIELRATNVVFDETALAFLDEAAALGIIRVIANHPDERNSREYLVKERAEREASHIPTGDPVLFLEVTVRDASDFAAPVTVTGQQIGSFHVLRASGASVPNTIAAVLLAMRDEADRKPHAYFGWTEGNPLKYLARFVLFGEGDIAPVTHEILRRAEPDPVRRPAVHVG
jgi:hypothetical protein